MLVKKVLYAIDNLTIFLKFLIVNFEWYGMNQFFFFLEGEL